MNGTARKPPDFALLINKRLGKGGAANGAEPPADPSDDLGGVPDDQKSMQLSAMKDFIAAVHARSPEAAMAAFGDLQDITDTGDDGDGPPPDDAGPPADDEGPPPPAA